MPSHKKVLAGLRIAAPAAFVVAQSTTFLLVFRSALGGISAPFVPHLTLSFLWIASVYGISIAAASIPRRWLRIFVLVILGATTVSVTTVFYLAGAFCLYGFRDLPTRGVVTGYFTQLPAMLGSLPFDRSVLAIAAASIVAILVATSAAISWCLAALTREAGNPDGPRIRLPFALAPSFVLALLVGLPPPGFITRFEPWTRSLYNHPLAESGLGLQSNPVEEAHDRRLEEDYPTAPEGKRLNVILIYIDALRADVLQPYGGPVHNMPFMSGLVARNEVVQFPRVFASCSMTLCGIGSLLQSRPAHRISPGNLSLPKVLRRQGYETRYLLSGDHQHFLALKQYYGPKNDFYLDGIEIDPAHSNDDISVFHELRRLPTARTATKPQFIMLGLMSAHIWGQRNERFRRWLPDRLSSRSFANIDSNSADAYRNNYLNGTLQADWVLGEIWDWLGKSGYLDNSIVIVTSDHGESLGENGHLGHARSLSTAETLIPLWIHDPTGRIRSRSIAFQEDIAPTVLDLLTLPKPESWTGLSLLQDPPKERWHTLYYINSRDKFGLILQRGNQTLKYLVDRSENSEHVYDLDHDLLEHHDLSHSLDPAALDEFRRALKEYFGTLLPPR